MPSQSASAPGSEADPADARRAAVERLHATPHRMVYAFAGAGSDALAWLHAVGGSSRTLLEAHDHYHPRSLAEALGAPPERSVAPEVARGLAERSAARARHLVADDDAPGPTFGLGVTATIATDRAKRGRHRFDVAVTDALGTRGVSVVLRKGARDRAGEEACVGAWVLHLAAEASGLLGRPEPAGEPAEAPTERFWPSADLAGFLADPASTLWIDAAGRPGPAPGARVALVSGSFHPMHRGHRELAAAAEAHLGLPAAFELSLANADKDALAPREAQRRAAQAYGERPCLLTHAPLFAEKAEAVPGSVFVIGVDTAQRVLEARFYGPSGVREALGRVRRSGGRFLVAGRAGEDGFRTLADLDVPSDVADLFEALPGFRLDLSSTELRAAWPEGA